MFVHREMVLFENIRRCGLECVTGAGFQKLIPGPVVSLPAD